MLGVGVDPVNLEQALADFNRWIEDRQPHYVCLAPVHNILACQDDPLLKRVFNRSDLTTPDGMPLVWIARASGYSDADRVYGPELLLEACRHGVAHGHRHYFYGAGEGVAAELVAKLEREIPGLQVAGFRAPPFRPLSADEEEAEVARIRAADPDIVWVALGSPRQERWMAENVARIGAPVLIGVGAAFDFVSGRKPWAPRWIQRSGFEWLFRLATEPRRLWRRYLRYPLFVFLYTAQVVGLKRFPLETGIEAAGSLSSGGSTDDVEAVDAVARQVDSAPPTADILGVRVLALSVESLHAMIAAAIETDGRSLLPNVNAHALNLAYEQPWLRRFFNQADAVFPDGSGALFAARFQERAFRERITYADWMWDLAEMCARGGYSLYFLGGRPGVAASAAKALQVRNPDLRIVGTHHGYFEKSMDSIDNQAVVDEINRLRPDILLVGMGMPLQERWLDENWEQLEVHVGLTAGAAFDYVSGRLRRPPRFLTDHGLEWLGRLLIEPRRLWRRYVLGIPKYSWRVLRQLVRQSRS